MGRDTRPLRREERDRILTTESRSRGDNQKKEMVAQINIRLRVSAPLR